MVVSSTLGLVNTVKKFKFNSNRLLSGVQWVRYLQGIPQCAYFEGTITEDSVYDTAYVGHHGMRSLEGQKNFPLWTVIGGATTGCLRPIKATSTYGNFTFTSFQLERSNFAIFDELGNIDLDPTKSFVANLPTLSGSVVQSITFSDLTFKNQFTSNEQTQIYDLVVNQKKWTLTW